MRKWFHVPKSTSGLLAGAVNPVHPKRTAIARYGRRYRVRPVGRWGCYPRDRKRRCQKRAKPESGSLIHAHIPIHQRKSLRRNACAAVDPHSPPIVGVHGPRQLDGLRTGRRPAAGLHCRRTQRPRRRRNVDMFPAVLRSRVPPVYVGLSKLRVSRSTPTAAAWRADQSQRNRQANQTEGARPLRMPKIARREIHRIAVIARAVVPFAKRAPIAGGD